MNNQINKTKRRADILAEYIVAKADWLEKENHHLEDEIRHEREISVKVLAEITKYRTPFRKVLENVKSVSKSEKGEIEIVVNAQFYPHYYPSDPLYPLAEKLLEEYENKVEFERLLRKGIKANFTPTTQLTKGE